MLKQLQQTHTLRITFWLFIIALMIASLFTGDGIIKDDWRIFPTLIIPSMVPFTFFLIPFDITMCTVQKSSCAIDDTACLKRYKFAIYTNIALFSLLLLAWWPFISALTD